MPKPRVLPNERIDPLEVKKLAENPKVQLALRLASKRYFRDKSLRGDAINEAWDRICACRPGLSAAEYVRQGIKGIQAFRMRERRNWLKVKRLHTLDEHESIEDDYSEESMP